MKTRIFLAAMLVVVGFAMTACSSGKLPESAPESASSTCALKCNINTESYSFDISCESGEVTNEMSNSNSLSYDTSGQVSTVNVNIDQKQTYSSSGNTYHIVGTITAHLIAGFVEYDIKATGGEFGDTPQTCQSGEGDQGNPASTRTPLPTLAPTPTYAAYALKAPDTYVPVISVPECNSDVGGDTTYLCLSTSGKGTTTETETTEVVFRHQDGDLSVSEVHLDFQGTRVSFQPAKNEIWKIGLYDHAQDYTVWQEPYNGLNVVYSATYYGPGTGRFEILEFVTSDSGELVRFAANFEQTVSEGPSFAGYVRYNSTIP